MLRMSVLRLYSHHTVCSIRTELDCAQRAQTPPRPLHCRPLVTVCRMKCPYLITPLHRRPLVIDNISLKNCYLPVLRTVNITAGQCFIQTPKHWEGGIKTVEGSTRSSSRRRRNRDADGVERVGNGEGYPPPQPTRGSGERCELPQWGPGRSPGRKRIWCTLELSEIHWWQSFTVFLSVRFTLHTGSTTSTN